MDLPGAGIASRLIVACSYGCLKLQCELERTTLSLVSFAMGQFLDTHV